MPRFKAIAALVAGAILAGVPVAAFTVWLGDFVTAQGELQAKRSADSTIDLAEYRIGMAIAALDTIASRGVASMRGGQSMSVNATNPTTAHPSVAISAPEMNGLIGESLTTWWARLLEGYPFGFAG